MGRKLMKYEFRGFLRQMFPFWLVILGVAILGRIVIFFESDSIPYEIGLGSMIGAFVIASIVALVVAVIFAIVRFYKKLYGQQGYMSFSFPVKPSAHILIRLLTAVLITILNAVVITAGVMIILSGEPLVEVFKAAGYILREIGEVIDNLPLLIVELVIAALVSTAVSYLLFYLCMTVGQLSNKGRIGLAIGVYIGRFFVVQFITTIIVILLSASSFWWLEDLIDALADREISIHLLIWIGIVFDVIIGVVRYILTHWIMKKHLNLE